MFDVYQDPWENEEGLQPMEGGRPIWGTIMKMLSSYFTGGALSTIGEGGATDVAAQQTSPGQYTMTAPDVSSWGAAQQGKQVSGAVRMPWQDDMQQNVDSFSKFFEKAENPNLTSAFSQVVQSIMRKMQASRRN